MDGDEQQVICRVSGIGNDELKVKSCWSKSKYEYGLTGSACLSSSGGQRAGTTFVFQVCGGTGGVCTMDSQALVDECRSWFCCSDIRMAAALVADEFIRKGHE